ncbi:MAG TPA: hypothetical protein VFV27_08265 [Nevskiaceae bacterium]|nr:hypothetical protein [Nevskiaceae bacterium]
MTATPPPVALAPAGPLRRLCIGFLWLACLVTVYALYRSGLGAGWLFDDYSNLDMLERLKGHMPLYDALQYALNGVSSTLGRPIALLSFTLQYPSWPRHPEDFLRVNVLIHLLNGCLLFWTLLQLQQLQGRQHDLRLTLAALAVAAAWLLLPLHISTVLYAVQRMTLLSATFVFLGLLLYLRGRVAAAGGHDRLGLLLMSVGIAAGIGLGVLSKESAILLPLMVLSLEYALPGPPQPRYARWWRPLALYLPLLLLAVYLLMGLRTQLAVFEQREFSMGERLLTQARLLFVYLKTLLLPGLSTGRIYFDDYPLSRSLLSPASTVVAVLAWLALIVAAVRLRRALPGLALGVFWFLACHLLESSFLPLEMGFEHRNYVAAAGVVLGLAMLLAQAWSLPTVQRLRPVVVTLAILYPLYLVAAASQSITLWGQPLLRATYWYQQQPDSRRAQHNVAEQLIAAGRLDAALAVYRQGAAHWPSDASFLTAQIALSCFTGPAGAPTPEQLRATALAADANVLAVLNGMLNLFEKREAGSCTQRTDADVQAYMDALDVPLLTRIFPASVLSLQARAAAAAGDAAAASEKGARAAALQRSIPALQDAVVYALRAGNTELALQLLERAETDPSIPALHRWTYRLEVKGLRQLVEMYTTLPDDTDKPAATPPG